MDTRPSDRLTGVPPERGAQLHRSRLLARLDAVAERPFTLVTGPMGSGKTHLVAQWCRERSPLPVTWIDAATCASLGAAVADALGSGPGVVVVDDLRSPVDATAITGLAASPDPSGDGSAHLLVTSRLPLTSELARWRLELQFDQLVDADLRLTPDELADLVALHAGERPAATVSSALCRAVDGWAAGAVLLALNWVDGADSTSFRSVLSSGLTAASALAVTATLEGADPATRELLERTACLPELAAPLCDELTGRTDSQEILRRIEPGGALLAAPASAPGLVRLHPLARAGLLEQRTVTEAERAAMLATAARWYEDHHHPFLAGVALTDLGEWQAAGELVFEHLHQLEATGQVSELADHFTALPVAVIQQNWDWVVFAVWMLYVRGDVGGAYALVAVAERGASPEHRVVAEFLRATGGSALSDPRPALDAAERALALCDQLPEDAEFDKLIGIARTEHWRAQCRGLALLAGMYLGEWDRIAPHDRTLEQSVALEMRPGEVSAARARRAAHAAMTGALAEVEREIATLTATGPLQDAHADAMAMQAQWALAEVHRGRDDPDAVEPLLAIADQWARERSIFNLVAAVAASRAQLALDLHDPARALAVLEAHRASTGHRAPPTVHALMVAAEARAHAALGRWEVARDLLVRSPRTPAVAGAFVLVLLDRGDVPTAEAIVEAWPEEPTVRSTVGQHLARAAICERLGLRREAVVHLRPALAAAAPHGLVQPFLQMGVHLLGPLWHVAQTSVEPGISALALQAAERLRTTSSAYPPLTQREQVVLHHLSTGGTLPEIAARLSVSANTVKSQVRSLYKKLNASSREDALTTWRRLRHDGEPPELV